MLALKRAALRLGLRGGVFGLAQFAARRRQAVILMFHRLSGSGEGHVTGLPIERFEEYIRYLTRHYRVVSLDTIVEECARGTVKPYSAAVTFDDGFHEVFTLAAPVLRRYGVPASVFVVSDFAEGRLWLWPDRFRYVFDRAPGGRVEFRHRGSIHVLEIGDPGRAEERWREYAKKLPVAEREELLEAIAEAWGVEIPATPPKEFRPMTWAQLRALAAEGFDVGAHTRTHPILSHLGPQQLRAEIEGCKAQIEEQIGFPVRHFAYPNGRRQDYTLEAVEAVSRAGYVAAVTSIAGGNTPSTSLFELRRIGTDVEDLAHFAQLVSGFEQAKLRVREHLHAFAAHRRVSRRPAPGLAGTGANRLAEEGPGARPGTKALMLTGVKQGTRAVMALGVAGLPSEGGARPTAPPDTPRAAPSVSR